MRIMLNRKSVIPVHDQIFREISNRITSGIFKAEHKLPSLRKMCEELNVSHMTMVRVYEELEAQGLIEKIHGKGTFVKSQVSNLNSAQAEQNLDMKVLSHQTLEKVHKNQSELCNTWQTEMKDYVSTAGFLLNRELKEPVKGVNLSIACLGSHLSPMEIIMDNFLKNASLRAHIHDLYPPLEGTLFMRKSVQAFMAKKHIQANLSEIFMTAGSQQAIGLIARTYIGPGDVVVVGAPTFPGALDVFKNRGAQIIEVPVDSKGMRSTDLLSVCEMYPVKLVYLMTACQNPTGAVMPIERMEEILELANYHNFLIVEDDACSDLVYEGSALSMKTLDKNGRVLYIFGFSKLYGHAIRLSAVIGSSLLCEKILSEKSTSSGGVPLLNQVMLTSFLNSAEQEHYLTDMTASLKVVRNTVYKELKKNFPDYVKVEKPQGGLVFWLTFPRTFSCNLLHYKCVEKFRITFLPGEFCYNTKKGRNQMRLSFTSANQSMIMDSISKIATLIDEVHEVGKMI